MKASIYFPLGSDLESVTCELESVPRIGDSLHIYGIDNVSHYPVRDVVWQLQRSGDSVVSPLPEDSVQVEIYLDHSQYVGE